MISLHLIESRVEGRSTPSPGLVLNLHIQPKGYDPRRTVTLTHLFPRVRVKTRNMTQELDSRVLALHGADVGKDQHFAIELLVETPVETLEAFESARRGSDGVELSVDVGATVLEVGDQVGAGQDSAAPTRTSRTVGQFSRVYTDANPLRVSLSRDEWVALLAQLQFADVLVLELDMRPPRGRSPFTEAATQLHAAQAAYHHGRYADVTVGAYKALESLAPGRRPGLPQRLTEKYFANVHEEVRKRASSAMQGLMRLTHVGRHAVGDDAAPDVDVDRHHAQLILATAATLVSWCQALDDGS